MESTTKKCVSCGKDIKEDAAFCRFCGLRVPEEVPARTAVPYQEPEIEVDPDIEANKPTVHYTDFIIPKEEAPIPETEEPVEEEKEDEFVPEKVDEVPVPVFEEEPIPIENAVIEDTPEPEPEVQEPEPVEEPEEIAPVVEEEPEEIEKEAEEPVILRQDLRSVSPPPRPS